MAALAEEVLLQAVSTPRKVKAITEHLCGLSFSASSISQLERKLDQALARFAHRATPRRHAPFATPGHKRHLSHPDPVRPLLRPAPTPYWCVP